MAVSPVASNFASAATSEENTDLKDVNLSNLKPGDKVEVGDYTVEQYTNEEAAKKIASQTGKSEKEVLDQLNNNNSLSSSRMMTASAYGACAQGATAFSRNLDVSASYEPRLHVWTELCENSAGQFVIKSIVDITMNLNDGGLVKSFAGNVKAQALNDGKTLYYSATGEFHNTGTTTVGASGGFGTDYASVSFNASETSSYYGYLHQVDNIYLF